MFARCGPHRDSIRGRLGCRKNWSTLFEQQRTCRRRVVEGSLSYEPRHSPRRNVRAHREPLVMEVHLTDAWRRAYPEASVGVLALDGVANPPEHAALAEHVQEIENELRERW